MTHVSHTHAPRRSSQLTALLIAALFIAAATSLAAGLWLVRELGLGSRWPSYQDIGQNLHLAASWWRWIVGDISEFAFYKHEFASIGLIAGALLAYIGGLKGKTWAGFAICYGTGRLPWLLTSSLLGLALSNLLWGWTLAEDQWQPTFVTFVSLPAAMVLFFGGGWRVTLTGALLSAVLVTPAALLIVNCVCVPLALPSVVGNVLGMASGSAVAFVLCRWLPALVAIQHTMPQAERVPAPTPTPRYNLVWVMRRTLADFSEAPFLGNELASLGLLLGVGIAWWVNPDSAAYGSGVLPALIGGQLLTAVLGILIWRRQWMLRGWYPTYIPLVSVVPAAILTHGASLQVILISATLGALIAPPLAMTLATRLPGYLHPYIGNVLSMAISTSIIVPLVGAL